MIKFIDPPIAFSINQYEDSIRRMTEKLISLPEVSSVYQIGSVSVPGISDVDLVVVFKDEESCRFNPLAELSNSDKYFYVHSLFGLSESQFVDVNDFLIQVQFKHLAGKNILQKPFSLTPENRFELNKQIALEYLVKNFISVSIQQCFKVVKLRNLLLEANALKYDFELLNIKEGRLLELVSKLINWRKKWFTLKPTEHDINLWFNEYCIELNKLLRNLFRQEILFSPLPSPVNFGKNISMIDSGNFSLIEGGIALPQIPGINPIHIYKISNRLSSFKLLLPMRIPSEGSIHQKRFSYLKKLLHYNNKHLPYFMPMVSALPITQ